MIKNKSESEIIEYQAALVERMDKFSDEED